jgi:hypothetical protein
MSGPEVRIVGSRTDVAALSRRCPGALVVGAQNGVLARDGATVFVRPVVARMILALAARPGAVISNREMVELLFGERADGGAETLARHYRAFALPALAALGYACEVTSRGLAAWPLTIRAAHRRFAAADSRASLPQARAVNGHFSGREAADGRRGRRSLGMRAGADEKARRRDDEGARRAERGRR